MNKITFSPMHGMADLINKYVTQPETGSHLIPQWFKDAPRYQFNESKMIAEDNYHNLTLRHCMPFIDSLSSGYFFTTWTDIYVERIDGKPKFIYENTSAVDQFGFGLIQYQEHFQSHVKQSHGYDPFLYAWSTYWRLKTPEGVSCLFTQPLNRTDLPFMTLSGIMDTDKWHGSDVLNFALQEGFEGLIPKGTPYVQIIPFKREDWQSEVLTESDEELQKDRDLVTHLRQKEVKSGYYRDNLWQNKKYL
jgi:hypothetical protein